MSNEMKDWKIERNKELCKEYPFLVPRNAFTGEIVEDYDYSWTELDHCEIGWQPLFLQMCEDIKKVLERESLLNEFRFVQIKEKYGELRAYTSAAPKEVYDIIDKYSYISMHICVKCGEMDVPMMDDGWVSPYCEKCFRNKSERHKNIEDISKYVVDDKPFDPKYNVERCSKGVRTVETIDVSDEWNRLKELMNK